MESHRIKFNVTSLSVQMGKSSNLFDRGRTETFKVDTTLLRVLRLAIAEKALTEKLPSLGVNLIANWQRCVSDVKNAHCVSMRVARS